MRLGLSYIGSMRIELIEPFSDNTVYADFVRKHGYGVHHFGILVDNMEEALTQARAAGLQMTMDGSGFGRDGDGHFAYIDTEPILGVTLELIDRPAERVEPEQIYPPED
jgi:4-hydroxyphenylpyruvate dioxygenase-like putative hemolysin